MKFSQRIGKEPKDVPFQLEQMYGSLRHSLWNLIHIYWLEGVGNNLNYDNHNYLTKRLQIHFFKLPVDELPSKGYD